ncbi:thiolase family protein [Deinococcus radiodurans]|uniref:Acetyl-CoA acetyltransferase n=1 Tax=Deinococcus radiodurans (strain ATCC 13939 / DSM 20539 / JCM 16871 / CCUG 27074 / LMG 4051 / NBRC 15346 / NCIMB 9279 / VKM B-1422 / R1) TaxID=243230 RepID=Q9RVF7_DEIRA|nr:acetyl-CoA C-acetyltransferase [Deinococcus radiodurans]AAF10641.1 acetyl-CoA acetyltransferase [Deinococcus radiodurans R1 = ATCC 13939 = DSM 20539]ANC71746.1 acetyl-CoA acetyltransferase [Deinococcus radiodurans R1 = ATCC 13939 = DSM 20539]QEM70555.1 acetyl-CoA C-acetyltransferase [Deinococcus radiodurans]QIP29162.1 acetyl-CoA C-acetyltransferase [Deinococcus radiodurans]QIP32142.1 acetyl-CoA C-acetyltransferase [Deinococcus radiodurans]
MSKAVIVAASRTPTGKFLGALTDVPAVELGAITLRETLRRSGMPAELVEEVIMGQVVQAGCGQNPARQAALRAGVSHEAGALTINKVCGSGLKAVMLAAQSIRAGDQQAVLAGGMESMSNAPHLLPGARKGYRLGHATVLDANTHDGLWCSINDEGMGLTGERVAEKYSIGREEQDAYATGSHRKAVAAAQGGLFKDEIVPVTIKGRKGDVIVDTDEGPRADTSEETLGKLKPAFKKDGSVTAGNAPGLNDGAASLLVVSEELAQAHELTPLAEIVDYASGGLAPEWVMMTPVPATQKLLKKMNIQAGDVDLWELNEAFSVQSLAVARELGLDAERVNVNGGAVALGHPIGASGARILVTLLSALKQQDKELGVATLCMGGGNGLALAVRRLG